MYIAFIVPIERADGYECEHFRIQIYCYKFVWYVISFVIELPNYSSSDKDLHFVRTCRHNTSSTNKVAHSGFRKPRVDVTKSTKNSEYQWPHKKNFYPPKISYKSSIKYRLGICEGFQNKDVSLRGQTNLSENVAFSPHRLQGAKPIWLSIRRKGQGFEFLALMIFCSLTKPITTEEVQSPICD